MSHIFGTNRGESTCRLFSRQIDNCQGSRTSTSTTSMLAGEISSDLYRDQFLKRILNFPSLMFKLMFFIDFWGLCDEKIHSRAQLFLASPDALEVIVVTPSLTDLLTY